MNDTLNLISLAIIGTNAFFIRTPLPDCIKNRIRKTQIAASQYHNKGRDNKMFNTGVKVSVNANGRLGNKLSNFNEEIITEQDLGTVVPIKGRRIHKNNLKLPSVTTSLVL